MRKLYKILLKIKMIKKLMFSRHSVLLTIDDENFHKLVLGKNDFEADMVYMGMKKYLFFKLLTNIDPIDVVLAKGEYEAEMELFLEKNKIDNEHKH